jgi:hypothetical protein
VAEFFSYEAYRAFLRDARAAIDIFPLRDWRGQPGMILRHDVDLDVEPAFRLAEVEAATGTRSTYFILTSAHTYNPASPANRRMLRAMAERGFEIGLHFDPTVHADAADDLLAGKASAEAAWLEDIVGQPVRSVSLHNPSIHGRYPLFSGFVNAYDPRIFSAECYASDSRMLLACDPALIVERARTRTTQLLLHPEHFAEATPEYPQPMVDYILRLSDSVHELFSVNTNYASRVGGTLRPHVARRLTDGA